MKHYEVYISYKAICAELDSWNGMVSQLLNNLEALGKIRLIKKPIGISVSIGDRFLTWKDSGIEVCEWSKSEDGSPQCITRHWKAIK